MNKKEILQKLRELNKFYSSEKYSHFWSLGNKDNPAKLTKDPNEEYHRCIGAITAIQDIYSFVLEQNEDNKLLPYPIGHEPKTSDN